jgi:hypothetical protein
VNCCINYSTTALQVDRHSNVALVASEVARVLPRGFPRFIQSTVIEAQALRATRPEAIALAVFGAIAAAAAFVIGAQVVGRQIRAGGDERTVLRALGAGRATTMADALGGTLVAILLGALLAVVVSVALSPLAPLGPVRRVEHRHITFDWTVLAGGFVALVVVLSATAVVIALRHDPVRAGRAARRPRRVPNAGSALPASAAMGTRFALDPGSGRTAVPVRSAIIGTALAIVVVVTTLTFASSLRTLVDRPPLFGWNWDDALVSGSGVGDAPQQLTTKLLNADHDVASWSGASFGALEIKGMNVPVLGIDPGATTQPPILDGHAVNAPNEVVLGAVTLAQAHEHVGDTIAVGVAGSASHTMRIVGTATLPAIGVGGVAHLEMGAGAVVPQALIPAAQKNAFADPVTGPNVIFVRFKPGVDHVAARRELDHVAQQLSSNANFGVAAIGVQRPGEIVSYRSLGSTPVILATGLAAGAVVALLFTLLASVRRRRRDLALLKTLGFTRRQLAATVGWQATIAVALGTVVGMPLGIVLGRQLWILFAREIHAVPAPTVSVATMLLIAAGALVLANIVAAFPGRVAARTPAAVLLETE